jgi:formate hydrogenlyase subunit 3/multisubunit Na+/H+ antiporter MnhD subunit
MTAPFVLILLTILFALLALALRNNPMLASIFTAFGAAFIAIFVLLAPIDAPIAIFGLSVKISGTWSELGRSLILDPTTRPMVGYLYLAGAFILAAGWIVRTTRFLNPIGMLILGVLAGSLMVKPFLFAAIFLEIAALGAVLLLVTARYPAKTGALRLLTLYTLAMMAILVMGWLLEITGVTEATPDLARRVTFLLAFGFAILMAVPPMHLWLPRAADEAHPYVLVFVVILLQGSGLFFLFRFLDAYPWLRESSTFFNALRMAGVVTATFGGIMAVSQRSLEKFMAYALIADLGVMLIAVGLGTTEGFRLALGLSGVRVISLSLWALCLSRLKMIQNQANFIGVAYRMPLVAAGLVVGIFSLAGFPLTAGFPGRWSLLLSLSVVDNLAAWSVILVLALIVARGLVWTRTFLHPGEMDNLERANVIERVYFAGGVAIVVLLGVFPQLIYPWIIGVAAGMTHLFP